MLQLFTEDLKVYVRTLENDSAGGDSVSYELSDTRWRVRVSPLYQEYVETAPSREYPNKIRIVGEIRNGLREGDRVGFNGKYWEITKIVEVKGIGSIPDYLRAEASCVGNVED
jgi:hypothetical protein